MNEQKKYKVIYSEEVDKFLETVNEKARRKIFYNINLVAGGVIDKDLFKKNLTEQISGNSELFITEYVIEFYHFGIQNLKP